MLARSAKLPIKSVALIASTKHEEIVSIVRNLLSDEGIYGVHHFSSTDKLVVIDVLRRLPRFFLLKLMTRNIPSFLVTKFVADDCTDVI